MRYVGTLHVGDEIREISGISVANQTVEQLQKMLVSDALAAQCPPSRAQQAGLENLLSTRGGEGGHSGKRYSV